MTREAEIAYAMQHGIDVPVKSGSAYSVDPNLWGRSIQAGPLEDPWVAPPEDCYAFTRSHVDAPAEPQEVVVRFVEGVPVAIDGEELPLDELIAAGRARSPASTGSGVSTTSRTASSASSRARSTRCPPRRC